ncbi:MAG: hypothetical protein WCL06_15730 [Bacteroidota bacterium]
MKITPTDVKTFIENRCKERIKASEMTNKHIDKWNRAMEMQFKLRNIFAPMLICRFLLENMDTLKDIIIVAAPYTRGHTAYVNKLAKLDDLTEFAHSYLMTGNTRASIDVVVMKNGGIS